MDKRVLNDAHMTILHHAIKQANKHRGKEPWHNFVAQHAMETAPHKDDSHGNKAVKTAKMNHLYGVARGLGLGPKVKGVPAKEHQPVSAIMEDQNFHDPESQQHAYHTHSIMSAIADHGQGEEFKKGGAVYMRGQQR